MNKKCKCGNIINGAYRSCFACKQVQETDSRQSSINWNGSWDRATTLVAGIVASGQCENWGEEETKKKIEHWQEYFWKKLQNGAPKVDKQKAKDVGNDDFINDLGDN